MFFLFQFTFTAAKCNHTTGTVLPKGITRVLIDFLKCKPNISNTFCRSQYDAYDIKDERPSCHRSGRQPKTYVKPEAAITVFELPMVGGVSPETW
jgi:hypothetical protein